VDALAEATLFDFAAVSIELRLPFCLPPLALTDLAERLGEPGLFVEAALRSLDTLYEQLLPAIQVPQPGELTEEYIVFQFARGGCLPSPGELLEKHAAWLTGLIRLERDSLSTDEIAESLRLKLSYTPSDLFIPEWSAAVLIDDDCEETLEVIEFANLQLLEFRYLDDRLDERLADAYRLIHPLTHTRLPFWRTHARSLRMLGDLRIDAHDVYERTSNVLKLVGDQYLARLYRQVAQRFHLDDWGQSILRSLDVVEGVYEVLADQSSAYRMELMELIIIVLIAFEILMAMAH
jgi:hypothetical protein